LHVLLRLSLLSTEGHVEAGNDSIINCLGHLVSINIVRLLLTASEVKHSLTHLFTVILGHSSLFHKTNEGYDSSTRTYHNDRSSMRFGHQEGGVLDEHTRAHTSLGHVVEIVNVFRSPTINFGASGFGIPFKGNGHVTFFGVLDRAGAKSVVTRRNNVAFVEENFESEGLG
jgi:hypothetical protein